jgi:hypothetical protein
MKKGSREDEDHEIETIVETHLMRFREKRIAITPQLKDIHRQLARDQLARAKARDKAALAFLELRNRKGSDEGQAPDYAQVIQAEVIDEGRTLVIYQVQTDAAAQERRDPPELAEFALTLFATTRHAEAMVGDLNERFTDECQKLGRSRAVRLYWARTLRSLWPLLKRAIGKAVKWGAVITAARRLF